jgi:ribosomal protein S18 acetylase RimI-like enzyme
MLTIDEARFPEQLGSVRAVFLEYAASLPVDLAFQDFAGELAALPGKYAAPAGRVLLASVDGEVIGCVALRALDADTAEMKRLYVRPTGRGVQLGRQLAEKICALARAHGYRRIRLDTMPAMTAAQQLYGSLGFRQVEAYVYNPVEGTRFMELDLE